MANEPTSNNEGGISSVIHSYLAVVTKVYLKSDKELDKEKDYIKIYNDNKNFDSNDIRFLGAIEFARESAIINEGYAFPFDKNNMTYPILGETVLIIEIGRDYYWLPYSNTHYPNYREDYKTSQVGKEKEISKNTTESKNKNYQETKATGTPNQKPTQTKSDSKKYKINEKIKFLNPKEGDTIISGRVGNTIRFSEFHLTEDGKTSSPSIFIRNKQNPEFDDKKIGELVEEDINKDGTSIYIVSNKVKVPFKEEIKKEKKGFKEYPSSSDFKGDQLFVNSDRIVLSAKAKEFIMFGKGNTGIITDGNFSIDAEKEIYFHNKKNITIHTEGSNQIFLNSDNGKVYLGKNTGEGDAGASVQKMVLGGELVKIMGELIDAITKQQYLTPAGPSSVGPTNVAQFTSIKSKLKTLLSAKNFLSKS
jgi:hypothetical protein